MMAWWGWLLVGVGLGALLVGVPVAVWGARVLADWDRAWGMR